MARENTRLPRRGVLHTIAGGLGVAFGSSAVAAGSTPAVETDGVDGVTSDAATLNLTVTDMGGEYSVRVYFEYGEAGTLDQETDDALRYGTGSWSVDVSGLDPSTTYDYRAVVEGDNDTVRGTTRSFTTADPNPTVTVSTNSPNSVSHCSAALWGDIDEAIDVSNVDVSFEYREAGASSWNTTRTERFESTGSVRHYVDGLATGTSYEYRLTASTDTDASDTGSIVTFDTDGSPTLKGSTDGASDVTDTSAVLNGTVDELGDASSADVLFRWGPPSNSGDLPPNTTNWGSVSSEGGYSDTVDGLDQSTTYEYWFLVDAGDGFDRGSKRTFTTTGPLLDVATSLSNDSTDTNITMNGELSNLGGADSVDVAFEHRQSGASSWNSTTGQTLSATGTFSATVENLPEETEFEYRAVANANDGDTDQGDVLFVSTSGDPAVTTESPTDLTANSVRLRGQVQDTGGASVEVSFEWGPAGDISNTTSDTFSVTDQFGESYVAADLSGLDPETTYEYRAVVDADDGESDTGSVVSFTTPSSGAAALSVTADPPTNVTDSAATLQGTLEGLGGASSVDVYFEWDEAVGDSVTTTSTQTLTTTGGFSADISGLDPDTTYEFEAFADASDGDLASSALAQFTTETSSSESALAVAAAQPSNVSESGARLEGSLDDLGGASSADVNFEWRKDGSSSVSSTNVQTLSSTGGFSAELSGLEAGTVYEYRAVANASDGDDDTSAWLSFTTDSSNSPPAVDAFSVSTADKPNPHATISTNWDVSDSDGNLDSVTVEVLDGGSVIRSSTSSVGGSTASGSDSLEIKRGGGTSYDVRLTVSDDADRTETETRTVTAA